MYERAWKTPAEVKKGLKKSNSRRTWFQPYKTIFRWITWEWEERMSTQISQKRVHRFQFLNGDRRDCRRARLKFKFWKLLGFSVLIAKWRNDETTKQRNNEMTKLAPNSWFVDRTIIQEPFWSLNDHFFPFRSGVSLFRCFVVSFRCFVVSSFRCARRTWVSAVR